MASNKLPSKKSIDELLEDLNVEVKESPTIQKKIETEDTIFAFLKFYNIEPGIQKIHQIHFYELYKQFTKKPVSPTAFNQTLPLYIPFIKIRNSNKIYLINQKALNLSEKALEFIEKKTRPGHKILKKQIHFQNFLKRHDIQPGKSNNFLWVSSVILYNLYDKWSYSIKKEQPLTIKEFRKLCRIYFSCKEDPQVLWFKIDNSILKYITPEMDSGKQTRNRLTNEKEEKQKK